MPGLDSLPDVFFSSSSCVTVPVTVVICLFQLRKVPETAACKFFNLLHAAFYFTFSINDLPCSVLVTVYLKHIVPIVVYTKKQNTKKELWLWLANGGLSICTIYTQIYECM